MENKNKNDEMVKRKCNGIEFSPPCAAVASQFTKI